MSTEVFKRLCSKVRQYCIIVDVRKLESIRKSFELLEISPDPSAKKVNQYLFNLGQTAVRKAVV
ncbi:MAG: hypothetical protein P9M03_02700 [Candidatus Theseobacter exili]|nr:hypothetical protein [Candidatus Theseobacter exili]